MTRLLKELQLPDLHYLFQMMVFTKAIQTSHLFHTTRPVWHVMFHLDVILRWVTKGNISSTLQPNNMVLQCLLTIIFIPRTIPVTSINIVSLQMKFIQMTFVISVSLLLVKTPGLSGKVYLISFPSFFFLFCCCCFYFSFKFFWMGWRTNRLFKV